MKNVLMWVLTVAAAAMLLLAGSLKLAGVEMEVQLFAAIGIGQWFRYFTGLLEIASAVGLFVATLAPFAAMLSAAVMTGAVLTHLFIVGGSPVAALLVLVASLTIAWLRRGQVSPLRARRIAA
jgi:hypothetical protein